MQCCACLEVEATEFRKCGHILCAQCSLEIPEKPCRSPLCEYAATPIAPLADSKRLLNLKKERLAREELAMSSKIEQEIQNYERQLARLREEHEAKLQAITLCIDAKYKKNS